LATLHKFQGWAISFDDAPNGIEDLYFNPATREGRRAVHMVSVSAIYHRFDSERLSLHYGNEFNSQIQAKWQRLLSS